MTSKRKKIFYFGIFWFVLIVSFIFFATLLILLANGYHFDAKTLKLEKTGMIILEGAPQDVKIVVNGKEKKANLPVRFSNLFPDRYDISIQKENYQDWRKSYQIEGGQAAVDNNVFLFFNQERIQRTPEDAKLISKVESKYLDQSKRIGVKKEELWLDDELITRFSKEISAVILDPKTDYFIVQIGDEIRVIDDDGQNDILLLKLTNGAKTSFYIENKKLFFLDGGSVFSAQIR